MLTAVFDSSDDEDTRPPYQTTTWKSSNLETERQNAAIDGLQAELSELSLEYEREGKRKRQIWLDTTQCLALTAASVTQVV